MFRKLADGEFCSAAHRRSFQEDQSKLAIARLMETQAELHRATHKSSKETQTEVEPDPPEAGRVPIPVREREFWTARIVVLDPIAYDYAAKPWIPAPSYGKAGVAMPRQAGGIRGTALIRAAKCHPLSATVECLGGRKPSRPVLPKGPTLESVIIDVSELAGLKPLGRIGAVARRLENYAVAEERFVPRTWLPLPSAAVRGSWTPEYGELLPRLSGAKEGDRTWSGRLNWLPVRVGAPALPSRPAALGRDSAEPGMACAARLPLRPAALWFGSLPEREEWTYPETSPVAIPETPAAKGRTWTGGSGMCHLALPGGRADHSTVQRHAPQEPVLGRAGLSSVAIPALPSLEIRDCRIQEQAGAVRIRLGEGIALPPNWHQPGDERVAVFEATETRRPVSPGKRGETGLVPVLASKLPIPFRGGGARKRPQLNITPRDREDFGGTTLFPRHRFLQDPIRMPSADPPPVEPASPVQVKSAAWARLAGRRTLAVKALAVFAPLLLFLAVRPWQHTEEVRSPKVGVSGFMDARLTAVKSAIRNRAGIELMDDFRNGLDAWASRQGAESGWSYDRTGFVLPGQLALYQPSMGLSDYSMEFLGQIDRKSLGWVYRASDMRNYHAAKLVIARPGPLPSLGLVRYSVVDGRESGHVEKKLILNVHTDSIFRVRLEARGSDFALYVQNQLADHWSDTRLQSGGVGFFSTRGEQGKIRWVQVTHQNDTLGRLCAYFTPVAMATYNPTIGASTK